MYRQLRDRFANRGSRKPDRKTQLHVELLEDRLTPSWAGVPPTAINPPSNALAVTLNSQGDASGTAAISSTEVDYYRFVAGATGSYTFQTLAQFALDPVLGVFNSSGQRLGFNDDVVPGSNTDSQLTLNLTAGRTYYLGITNYTGSPGGGYTWSINGPTPTTQPVDDGFENNDTFSTASGLGTITATRTITGLVMQDAHDYYRFTIGQQGTGGSVAISFQHSQGDLDLELLRSDGSRVARADGVADSETISLSGLAAGTYTVHVYGYQGARNPNYTLTVAPPTPSGGGGGGTSGFNITLRLTGLSESQRRIFEQAAARWAQVIVGDLPAATFNGIAVDDVLIDASAEPIDGPSGVLGQAGPDSFRSGSSLPIHGVMEFDTADLNQLESTGQLFNVIVHEMGHVLGVGTIWRDRGLLSGATTTNPRFTGAQATAEYNRIFGTNATSVPVENGGGAGTRNSHWRESVLGNELMTGFLDNGSNPLSRITVASMADLGYQINLAAADAYAPPNAALRTGRGGSGGGTALRSLLASPGGLDATEAPAALPGRDVDAYFSLVSNPNAHGSPTGNVAVRLSSLSSPDSTRSAASDSAAGPTRSASLDFSTEVSEGEAEERDALESDSLELQWRD